MSCPWDIISGFRTKALLSLQTPQGKTRNHWKVIHGHVWAPRVATHSRENVSVSLEVTECIVLFFFFKVLLLLRIKKQLLLHTSYKPRDWNKFTPTEGETKSLNNRVAPCFPNTPKNDPGGWRIRWAGMNFPLFFCDPWNSLGQLWIFPDQSDGKKSHTAGTLTAGKQDDLRCGTWIEHFPNVSYVFSCALEKNET